MTNFSQVENSHADPPARNAQSFCVHQLFEIQALKTPRTDAVIFENQSISYSELNRRANQLAWRLIELNVSLDEPIGICAERSIETIIGIVAVLKAGGACLPLDPAYPKERLAFMLGDGGVRILLLDDRFRGRLPENGVQIIKLNSTCTDPGLNRNPAIAISPQNLAYVIYTSGSTGKPKGVEVAHCGIVRLLVGVDYVDLDETKALLQLSALTFDGSIFDIWGALLHGGRSVLYPGGIPSIAILRELLGKHRVTTAWLTTAVFNAIVDEDPTVLASLKQILVGGEALSVSHIRRAWDYLPGVQIINAYGPTEATVFACSYRIPAKPAATDSSIPIGVPINETRAYILDENLSPVPTSVSGELYLGGPGVARGYRNRPDLTAEKFIADPFGKDPRLYKTGDFARCRPDGNIDFLGRVDTQVKLRGFRIELSEVEETARRHPDVRDAVAVIDVHPSEQQFLSLFVLPKADKKASSEEILLFLRQSLPEFMVPDRCRVVDQWPLTSSGKIDRHVLVRLPDNHARTPEVVGDRTELEKALTQIWEELLNIRPVGISESFLEIGGDSLLAVRLFARIEQALGVRLPAVVLWEAPTIEKLAAFISEKGRTPKLAYARAVQSKGEGRPFFCVGAGPLIWPLARALGPSQPFFSVGIEPAAADLIAPPYRLEQLASYLVAAILEKQPRGPYYLGGFCLDGLWAYEIARQLVLRGHEVGLLVLFETDRPSAVRGKQEIELGLKRRMISFKRRRDQLRHLGFADIPRYLKSLLEELSQSLKRTWLDVLSVLHRLKIAPASKTLGPILYIAARSYEPLPLTCRTALFRCDKWPIASAGDPYLGWRELLKGSCETYEVPGDHTGIFGKENVGALAETLRRCISGKKALNYQLRNFVSRS